ncbi:MAG: hypothetical protein MUE60_09555 [Candidatus Eisenbacteria bacterium]|nr:hypothetical protein [Candidatus Eisenbacteria bacterium]
MVNACSAWLLRDFLLRWAAVIGPLAPVLSAKSDEELGEILEEVDSAMRGQSSHQLAAQLAAPWLMTVSTRTYGGMNGTTT